MKRMMLCLMVLSLGFAAPMLCEERDDDRERPRDFGAHGWGLRFGVGDDPDQAIAGVQWDFGEFKAVHLEPNIELMVGDDHLTLSGLFAAHYRFRYVDEFRPYVGAGLGLAVTEFDPPGQGDDTDLEIGLRVLGGCNWALKNGREAFVELSFGISFVNDVQIMGGWSF
jgi:opacity protein-like surface antigen